MRTTYDPKADAMSVDIVPGAARARTVKVSDGVLLHFDKAGHPIELELLWVSDYVPKAALAQLSSPAVYLTLAEAAKAAGLSAAGLRVLVNKGKLRAEKRGRDWVVSEADLWNYLDNRDPRGAPPTSRKARKARKEQRATVTAASSPAARALEASKLVTALRKREKKPAS